MVSNAHQTTLDSPVNQGVHADTSEPNKIGASTPYDFAARNLAAYGGLLPVTTMLEKLAFQQLVEETLTVKRQTRSMPMYGFILGMVLACYVGFSRLNHLRFLKREPMLTGILRVAQLPPQCIFWRFPASLRLGIARQLLAYNLNCWLELFSREENVTVKTMKHTTLATARLRFLFLAARIWRHASRVGIRYSDHYQEKGAFQRLMKRLRKVARGPDGFAPVLPVPLCTRFDIENGA
jgi:hypothetical protein